MMLLNQFKARLADSILLASAFQFSFDLRASKLRSRKEIHLEYPYCDRYSMFSSNAIVWSYFYLLPRGLTKQRAKDSKTTQMPDPPFCRTLQ